MKWLSKFGDPVRVSTSRLLEVMRAAIHPGEHLADQLGELGMSAAELGRQLDVPTNRIIGILNGQRAITGDSALRLAHFFGTSAEFWLNVQKLYELRLAEAKAEAGAANNGLKNAITPKKCG